MVPGARPSIIDVEASGFGPFSYPIEIGLALSSGERFCTLIAPHPEWTHWDEEAEKEHEVTQEILTAHGRPLQAVAANLNEILEGQTIYSDGWVVDKPWVDKLFYMAGVPCKFSVSALELILSEPQMDIWHTAKNRVITDMDLKRHRASSDALIIQETYARTLARTTS
ncbi:MAG: hypothetical protein C0617_05700 [Desulfuromonas sp.]|uniref:hypothetical protein n=1 Tax=Desulfuromonas sp. TaxID=892 RepID=UPI000CB7F469|nr:hypothetical protein [Desulfuromonas sp.]PLX85178.1 MAG: hypothetical protein C0617_05700 [Desulfuromonas sp.]